MSGRPEGPTTYDYPVHGIAGAPASPVPAAASAAEAPELPLPPKVPGLPDAKVDNGEGTVGTPEPVAIPGVPGAGIPDLSTGRVSLRPGVVIRHASK